MGTVTEIVHDYARLHNRPFGMTNFVDGLAAQGGAIFSSQHFKLSALTTPGRGALLLQ